MINKLFKLNKNLCSVTVETKLRANSAMLHDLSMYLSTNTLISAIRVPTSIKYECMKRKDISKRRLDLLKSLHLRIMMNGPFNCLKKVKVPLTKTSKCMYIFTQISNIVLWY